MNTYVRLFFLIVYEGMLPGELDMRSEKMRTVVEALAAMAED